jgi:lipopolysaccharide/colanic/teichoic acid biosynthesis glycosyltransferase
MDRDWRRLRLGVVAGDVLAVFLAYTLAAGARFGFEKLQIGGTLEPVYPVLSLAVALFTVALGWQYGTYRDWALFGGHRVYPQLATVATYGLVSVIILSYLVGGPLLVSRGWLVGSWAGSIVLLSVSRFLWRQVALRRRRRGMLVRKLLIAGANQQGIAVAQQLNDPVRHGTLVVGFLDDYQRPGTEVIPRLTVVGHPGNVLELALALDVDEVIIIAGALAWESQRQLAELVTRADSPLEARISPTFYDLLTTSAELSHIAYVPMLRLMHTRLSGINAFVKLLMDRSVAAVLLSLLIPCWCYWRLKAWLLGVAMLEQQPVLGVRGRPFEIVGLNRRLTTSPVLARLPALWNVLWLDLGLVGPRPIRADEVTAHERWLANLFAMRPGLTGLWRLRGRELPVEELVALDLYYIRNYTVALDLQILQHTARGLLQRLMGKPDRLARWEARIPRPVVAATPAAPPSGASARAIPIPHRKAATEPSVESHP